MKISNGTRFVFVNNLMKLFSEITFLQLLMSSTTLQPLNLKSHLCMIQIDFHVVMMIIFVWSFSVRIISVEKFFHSMILLRCSPAALLMFLHKSK